MKNEKLNGMWLLIAFLVLPVFWESYELNSTIIIIGLSVLGLCVMDASGVKHKNIKLICSTFISALKLLGEKRV